MADELQPNKRIICVDDEPGILEAYVDTLSPKAGTTPKRTSRGGGPGEASASPGDEYELLSAPSGEAALDIMRKELAAGRRISGGFFDVKMDGGIDGIQTIQEMWKLDPDIHCTIVTAYQDRSVQDINQLFGPRFKDQWDYLNKPFNQGEIIQKARQMTASWNRKRSLEDAMEKLKAAQLQLIHSERMAAIGQIARSVGHEFGNILQRIVGKADLALGEKDPAKLKESLEVILQASDKASHIVRNLQSYSKGGKEETSVEIAKVIGDTIGLMGHELMRNKINLVDKRAQTHLITSNAVELQQVFMNLVINSMHAMTPQGGSLEIGCASDGDSAVAAWVRDTGTGIRPEILPKIFDYAFTTKGDKGSGLGLSITQQIVKKFHGTIEVKSEVGKGTIFVLRFPKAK